MKWIENTPATLALALGATLGWWFGKPSVIGAAIVAGLHLILALIDGMARFTSEPYRDRGES
jgi:hypothetical protein